MTISFVPVYETGDYDTTRCVECKVAMHGSNAVSVHTNWHQSTASKEGRDD